MPTWLLDVSGVRPWLGPHMAGRYEWQLSTVERIGLDDLEMDQTIALLAGFASNGARAGNGVSVGDGESALVRVAKA